MLDEDKVQGIFSTADEHIVEEFTEVFNSYAKMFKIDSEFQTNAFLAELRQEVGPTLIPRREILNYSCNSLKRIFRYYRRNPREADRDGRCNGHRANKRKIANKVYANRIGNGGYATGDGYRFRGGGYFQLTGRGNYQRIADVLSEVLNADISPLDVETEITSVTMALLTAMAFYYDKKLYNCEHIDCFTRKINRYTDSYQRRKKYYLYIASL